MTITNIYESNVGKLKGHCLSGKVEGGVMKKDEKLLILPLNTQFLVKEILLNHEKVKEAVVGDNIDIQIKMIDETSFESIKQGFVVSSLKYSIPVTQRIVV
jgi:translation elongation factor EF-1alpha